MIELSGFSCSYGKNTVVQPCSFSLHNGELTGLLGANGCGKSTLLKGLCNRIQTAGACRIDGLSHAALQPRELARHLAYIPQRCGVTISCSLLDVVLMGANAQTPLFADYSAGQRREAAEVLRLFTDLSPDADFLSLSEGQKQLVILARAFFQHTDNLLLDEPESALDFSNKHMILEKIRSLSLSGKCVLLSLHDPSLALRYCHRLLFMQEGRIIGDVYPAETDLHTLEGLFARLYPNIRLIPWEDQLILIRK